MYSHGNAQRVSQDVQVLLVVGQLSSWAYAVHNSDDEQSIYDANIAIEIEVARAQVIATDLVPRSATELFNALGASDTRVNKALDRCWRNARTLSSHNPVIYKIRDIGNWEVNKQAPTFIWQIGRREE